MMIDYEEEEDDEEKKKKRRGGGRKKNESKHSIVNKENGMSIIGNLKCVSST